VGSPRLPATSSQALHKLVAKPDKARTPERHEAAEKASSFPAINHPE
jgi:hypothetical protein